MPSTIGAMVAIESAIDRTSTRPGFASFDSGTKIGARTSRSSSTGTASRKTEPHHECSSRNPPAIGPIALPAAKPAAQIAIASRRSSRSVKTISAEIDGGGAGCVLYTIWVSVRETVANPSLTTTVTV